MLEAQDAQISSLGPCRVTSPMHGLLDDAYAPYFVDDAERVRVGDRLAGHEVDDLPADSRVGFELAGPRAHIYFEPAKLRCGIVTCGGLCPGINDVIRGLVMSLWHRYGVRQIVGFRYGLQGFVPRYKHAVVELDPSQVLGIHQTGGTMLGTSRGRQNVEEMVDCLERMNIGVLFVVGGGGTMQAALAMARSLAQRDLKTAVVGIPKAIDNDLRYIDQSFGFETAFAEAVKSIRTAHVEATGAPRGVGLVKLMGRHSGFIACHATLASGDVNFALIPEVPFRLLGEHGLLRALERRLDARGHAVIVVAEGADDGLLEPARQGGDAEGSDGTPPADIGEHLRAEILRYFVDQDIELSLKYVDPSYDIRSVPASASDSIYCLRLAQNAVHAAMCGKTAMLVGQWHGSLVHVPMKLTVTGRKQVDPRGDLWLSVLEDTGQPVTMG